MPSEPVNLAFSLARSVEMLEKDPKTAKEAFHAVAQSGAPLCPSCLKPVTHRQGVGWCEDREMSEKTLQNRFVDRAKRKGWKVAHAGVGWVGDQETGIGSYVTPMAPGWPDLTLAKAGHRLIFVELKRENGVVSPEQWEWITLLNACGARAVLIRPSDLREGRVSAMLKEGSPL